MNDGSGGSAHYSELPLGVERTRSHTLEAAIPGSLTSLLPPSDRFKW
jgi:hypothetical protein